MNSDSAWFIFSLWILTQAGLFAWRFWWFQTAPSYAPIRHSVGLGLTFAKSFAILINLNAALLPLCMLRLLSTWFNGYRWIRGWLPLDRQRMAHRWIAGALIVAAIGHSVAHVYNFSRLNWQLLGREASITGIIMFLLMLSMVAVTMLKRRCWECFWYWHQVALWLVYVLLGVHGAFCTIRDGHDHCSTITSYRWFAIPMLLYVVEWFVREIRSRRACRVNRIILHQAGVLELQIETAMRYIPGQYVLLCCPSVSRLQWHPFTITSAPHEPFIRLHIRPVGNWTIGLISTLGIKLEPTAINGGSREDLQLRLDGPWGAPAQAWLDYSIVLCVGAGIGQTPFASILKHLSMCAVIERVIFYGICRDTQSFEWFHDLLREVEQCPHIELRLHLTGSLPLAQVRHVSHSVDWHFRDPITGLLSPCRFGRPRWQRECFDPLLRMYSGRRIGVFYCGPYKLGFELASLCTVNSAVNGTRFDFYQEHF